RWCLEILAGKSRFREAEASYSAKTGGRESEEGPWIGHRNFPVRSRRIKVRHYSEFLSSGLPVERRHDNSGGRPEGNCRQRGAGRSGSVRGGGRCLCSVENP